jgi:peroxiredoxin
MPTMTIQTGDKLPDATFVKVTENGPEQVSTADYFAGRRVALFSVPGAFTPTCSAKHLPGFVDKAGELGPRASTKSSAPRSTMPSSWAPGARAPATASVTMLADGNGDFAEAVGLTMDGKAFGMGKRGQRFSMIVNDGVVEQLNVEVRRANIRSAPRDHMLGQL